MQTTLKRLSGACLALLLSAGFAQGAEVRVIAAGALQVALKNLIADFDKKSGNTVTLVPTNPANLLKDMASAPFDVVCAASVSIEEFDDAAMLQPNSRKPLARTGIGVAVKEGTQKPDISNVAAFKRALLAAKNIVYSDPTVANASGAQAQHILVNAGLLDAIKSKSVQAGLGPGREGIAKGDYEMGLFNVSEALAPGVVLAGPVPAPLQQYINYDVAVLKTAVQKKSAADFISYVTAKSTGEKWRAAGLEQLPPR
jgi:molybdate transport system substrate-binding protein